MRYTTFLSVTSATIMIISLVVIGYPLYTFIEDAKGGKFDISLRNIVISRLENDSIVINFTVCGFNNGRVKITDIFVEIQCNYTTIDDRTYSKIIKVYIGSLSPQESVERNLTLYLKGFPKSFTARVSIRMNISGFLPFKMTFEVPIL
ncbi:MAG: hypothetical protein DRN30_00030 [Thermoplasmata archaeon]|nr:hypothetical protein [Euryarchaeota archaeon]RLF67374.1 MAG: hypothetical protein DRN30_00030 [Thermoplasmata archaeon]